MPLAAGPSITSDSFDIYYPNFDQNLGSPIGIGGNIMVFAGPPISGNNTVTAPILGDPTQYGIVFIRSGIYAVSIMVQGVESIPAANLPALPETMNIGISLGLSISATDFTPINFASKEIAPVQSGFVAPVGGFGSNIQGPGGRLVTDTLGDGIIFYQRMTVKWKINSGNMFTVFVNQNISTVDLAGITGVITIDKLA